MDPRLHRDINTLSTDDLVLCYGILRRMWRKALRDDDAAMAEEFRSRMTALDRELAARQISIDDELERLRAHNAST